MTYKLQKSFLGLTFKNPVGLGAGFDKNAKYLNELEALGFWFCRNWYCNTHATGWK